MNNTKIENTDIQERIMKGADWLTQSGVQVVSDNPLHSQGFAAWYEADTQTMPYVYSEITGYLTTMMCHLYDMTGEQRFLESAVGAADWLLRTTHAETGGFRCLFPLKLTRFDYKNSQVYIFDTGVIISGLVDVYRATGEQKYLIAAKKAADWIVDKAQKPSGGFYAVYDTDKSEFFESDSEWSLCSGSYHTKVAIGLINLYDATQNPIYKDAAIKACDFALTFQQEDGRFISFPSEGGTNSHPHAYSAEGLWVVGKVLERQDYLDASAKAAAWLLQWQSEEGYVPRHFHNGEPLYNERVDILAQTLRLAAIHIAEGRLEHSTETNTKLEKLLTVITRNQATSSDKRIDGGLYFGRLSNGEQMQHVNVWVTAFAIQAFALYNNLPNKASSFNPFFMV